MGFGWLFLGYFVAFLMSFHKFGFFTEIIGYYLIFLGLEKLSLYKNKIKNSVFPLIVMTIGSGVEAFFSLRESISGAVAPAAVMTAVTALCVIGNLFFHIFLLASISSLGQDTELPDVCRKAKTALFFAIDSVAVQMLSLIISLLTPSVPGLSVLAAPLTVITVLLYLVVPILVLILVWRCYASICAPGDETMPVKPSRFAFVNKWRERSEEKNKEIEEKLSQMNQQKKK